MISSEHDARISNLTNEEIVREFEHSPFFVLRELCVRLESLMYNQTILEELEKEARKTFEASESLLAKFEELDL